MNSFLVVRILSDQSISIHSTLNYGDVELRSYSTDTELEIEILRASAYEVGLDFDRHSICARISTIVECESPTKAIHIADGRFLVLLDFKSTEYALSTISVSRIGLIKDLASGETLPIKKTIFQPSLSFVMARGTVQCFDRTNFLMLLDNELSDRYRRSLHWARNSKNENSLQLKLIFLWFSVEALLKADESDNSVESYVRLFLGFPNGLQCKLASKGLTADLENHPRYDYWKRELPKKVEKIRNFRNDSVHSGFRSVDFKKEDLNLFSVIMTYAVTRCQAGVMRGLISDIKTLKDFKKNSVMLFEDNANLINDVHNSIIYSLDNPISY